MTGKPHGQVPRLESRRGPGSYGSLQELAGELGIADQVDLRPGQVEDMRAVYHALDVYVLPSRGSEGSSRAGLEACACGLPVLASAVGVLPDLLVGRKTGILLPPGNEEALGEVLRNLVLEWPKARALGEAARKRMTEHFKESDYVAQMMELIADAVQRARERQ